MKPRQSATQSTVRSTALLLTLAALSMGNEGCEQTKARTLRMDVELGSFSARPVRLPTGETIDFAYVVNSLFYRQVMNDPHFMIAGATVGQGTGALAASSTSRTASSSIASKTAGAPSRAAKQVMPLSKLDAKLLTSFGFTEPSLTVKAPTSRSSARASKAGDTVSALELPPNDSQMPACLYNSAMARLGGEMISFEATWGAGVGVGYGKDGSSLPGGVTGNVDFSSSKLDMGLRWDDPLRRQVVAVSDAISHQAKIKFGIGFNPGVPIGFDFFFNTPIADVIRTAISKGLVSIVDQYVVKTAGTGKTWDDVWESRVVYDPVIADNDTHVAFKGGTFAGMQKGDKFTVTNLHYQWVGTACESDLRYKIPLSDPVAELEVVSVGDTITVARVTKYLIEQRIRPGAQVKILELYVPPAKTPTRAQASNTQR